MASTMVGGAFLFDRLASCEVLDCLRTKKFSHGLLKKLKIVLLSVNSVLNDAEEKQIRNPDVRECLDELEDAAYDADDHLDGIGTDALLFNLEANQSRSGTGKVSKIAPNSLINFFDPDMEIKMEEILERLEIIAKQKDVLGLIEGFGEKPAPRILITSLVEETEVFGGDKESIINLLLRDDDEGSKKFVIPVLGMGGVGKTTLAQLVYNDEKVKEHFELKSWVCVSKEFDICGVMKTILQVFTSSSYENRDLDLLQIRLKEGLMGKKFLIVLDDVWNENYVHGRI